MSLSNSAVALLDTFDQVANSNTFLLFGTARGPIRQSLDAFLSGDEFSRALLRADLDRDWWNFHHPDSDSEPAPLGVTVSPERSYQEELSQVEFGEALVELLMTGKSFYNRRLPRAQTEQIVNAFVTEYLPSEASVLSVNPDFLFSEWPSGPVPFFERWGWDRCWVWHRKDELLMLLINGCP